MTRLPAWAVPQSYDLALKGNPVQSNYTGAVRIDVQLKQASDHLWPHGKGLKATAAYAWAVGPRDIVDGPGIPAGSRQR